ncbi:MAG: MFS transporter [Candidatus Buchananbacteria bacterium]
MSKEKITLLITALVDVIGIGIVIPSLPSYVLNFGVTPAILTLLFAVFSFCAFFSTPVLGVLSDRYGRRPILLISIFSSAVGWLIFSLAPTMIWLFIGRIVDGLAAGNISTAHSAMTDLAKTPQERTHNLGLMGAVFGIGFIIGPAIGGLLGAAHPHAPFWFAFALSTINLISVYFFFPETNQTKNLATNNWRQQIQPLRPLIKAWQNQQLKPLFSIWFLFSVAIAIQQSIMALYLLKIFNIGTAGTGWIMAGVGLGIALNQGIGLKHFWLKYFSEPTLQLWLFLAMAVAFFLFSWPLLITLALAMILNVFGQSVLRVILTSQAAGTAPLNQRGEVMGVMSSIMSLGMIVGPLISGQLFSLKTAAPFWLTTFLMLIAFGIVFFRRQKMSELQVAETPETNTIID